MSEPSPQSNPPTWSNSIMAPDPRDDVAPMLVDLVQWIGKGCPSSAVVCLHGGSGSPQSFGVEFDRNGRTVSRVL